MKLTVDALGSMPSVGNTDLIVTTFGLGTTLRMTAPELVGKPSIQFVSLDRVDPDKACEGTAPEPSVETAGSVDSDGSMSF